MFRHLGRLIWNRKRENALLLIELVAAFLIVFFIAAGAAHSWWLYRQPLGFEWQDSWEVRIATGGQAEWTQADGQRLIDVLTALRGHPDIDWAHVVRLGPFRSWMWTSTVRYDGVEEDAMFNTMSDGAPQDLGLELVEGRWFGPEDAGREDDPVVINERLVSALFGEENPMGQDIRSRDEGEEDQAALTVVGIFRDFRQRGELSRLSGYVLGRHDLEELEQRANSLVIRTRPDLGAAFEEDLIELLGRIAPEWRFTTTPLAKIRAEEIRKVTVPLAIGGVVCGFLLLMVAFGLFGVLWQNVTRRTSELGLRRAVGATRESIRRQIVGEMTLVAASAVVLGALIGVQFPMLGTFESLDWRATLQAIGVAGVLIVLLCATCAIYPAALAARRRPADALHYE